MNTPLFPLLPSLRAGFRHLASDRNFLGRLIAFPILVSFASLVVVDLLDLNGLLWLCVFQVPGDFVKGIFLALYVRYLLFKEHPSQAAQSPETQRDLAVSTLLYTAINFGFAGLMAGLILFYNSVDPTQLQSTWMMIAGIGGMMVTIWLFRFQWLPIGAAAGYPAPSFLRFLGTGFQLPIRIMALWILGSIPSVLLLKFMDSLIRIIGGFNPNVMLSGPTAWLAYLVNAAIAVLTAAILTAASVHAIKHCMKERSDV